MEFDKAPELHIELWPSEGVDFSLSYGVKSDGVLVAFLLHIPQGGMVNVDERNHLINQFFLDKGLTNYLCQYEMALSR